MEFKLPRVLLLSLLGVVLVPPSSLGLEVCQSSPQWLEKSRSVHCRLREGSGSEYRVAVSSAENLYVTLSGKLTVEPFACPKNSTGEEGEEETTMSGPGETPYLQVSYFKGSEEKLWGRVDCEEYKESKTWTFEGVDGFKVARKGDWGGVEGTTLVVVEAKGELLIDWGYILLRSAFAMAFVLIPTVVVFTLFYRRQLALQRARLEQERLGHRRYSIAVISGNEPRFMMDVPPTYEDIYETKVPPPCFCAAVAVSPAEQGHACSCTTTTAPSSKIEIETAQEALPSGGRRR